jgi:DNA-binding CsgD family transcriptional regulator
MTNSINQSPARVTKRQAEIIELRRKLTRKDVAGVLGISENTVKTHLKRAYETLGAETATDAYMEVISRRAA